MSQKQQTVVLIHGAGGGAWEYDSWRPVLTEAGFQVIANDLRPARAGLAQTTLADYIRQMQEEMPRTGRVILVGASMGGIIAMKVAEQVRPAALVLVNSVAPRGVGPARTGKRSPAVVRWANGPLEETRAAMPDSDEATIQRAWKGWRDESGAVMNALHDGVTVAKPRCPVLSILGEKDTDVPYTTGLALAKWANADALLYRGMSHVGPLLGTRAGEVARSVVTWCRSR